MWFDLLDKLFRTVQGCWDEIHQKNTVLRSSQCLYLPVFLSTLHELQAFVHLCFHLTNMGYRVDSPSIVWSQSEALHKRVTQFEVRRGNTDAEKCYISYTTIKWLFKRNGMLKSQFLSFVWSKMFLNLLLKWPSCQDYYVCITHSAQQSRPAEGWMSCLLSVFDSKLLGELNWHKQHRHRLPGPPSYSNGNNVYSRL